MREYEIDIIVNENRIYHLEANDYREAVDKAESLFRNHGRRPKGVRYVETARVWNTYLVEDLTDE